MWDPTLQSAVEAAQAEEHEHGLGVITCQQSNQDEEGRYLSGQTGEQGQLPELWTVRLVLLELDADLQGLA